MGVVSTMKSKLMSKNEVAPEWHIYVFNVGANFNKILDYAEWKEYAHEKVAIKSLSCNLSGKLW